MGEYNEEVVYFMAAEKVTNLVYTCEMTIDFFEEFKIEPETEVVNALMPMIKKLETWMKSK